MSVIHQPTLLSLYPHQDAMVTAAAQGLTEFQRFMIQGATGIGKTRIFTNIAARIFIKYPEDRLWIIVPRNELMDQASKNFTSCGLAHGMIKSGMHESRAFRVHLVSKQTLDRRWDRIKNPPRWIFLDEAHLNFEFQKKLREMFPEAYILGFTATPERTDGQGLKEVQIGLERENGAGDSGGPDTLLFGGPQGQDNLGSALRPSGGIWGGIAYGPSIPWLTERGFLAELRYYAPPIEGLDKLHWRGGEVDETELDELLDRKKVYGDVVRYYTKYGRRDPDHPRYATQPNKPALIFCRSVKSAKETARQFNEAGYNFLPIWGGMPKSEREAVIQALRDERIDGVTNCDLATYGLDIPNLEYGASIRPTQSRSLYMQMLGRLLRVFFGKLFAVFFDHVNMVLDHQEPHAPGVPLPYLDEIHWNFEGRTKRPRVTASQSVMRVCPMNDFQYCRDSACASGCRLESPDQRSARLGLEVDDTVVLEEIKRPVKFTELAPEDRREVQDRISRAVEAGVTALQKGLIDPGSVGELLALAKEMGYKPMWAYWHLVEELSNRKAAAMSLSRAEYEQTFGKVPQNSLLHEIGRQLNFKPGWAYMKAQELKKGIKEEAVLV